ncbi:MAG: hypothetical protein K2K53_10820 [Oscillospiraceae bacterium]|nr:hypothetical protein [Oscillospiraceae bacterium]
MRDKPWEELAALLLVLGFAPGADGLMDALGLTGFLSWVTISASWALGRGRPNEHRL